MVNDFGNNFEGTDGDANRAASSHEETVMEIKSVIEMLGYYKDIDGCAKHMYALNAVLQEMIDIKRTERWSGENQVALKYCYVRSAIVLESVLDWIEEKGIGADDDELDYAEEVDEIDELHSQLGIITSELKELDDTADKIDEAKMCMRKQMINTQWLLAKHNLNIGNVPDSKLTKQQTKQIAAWIKDYDNNKDSKKHKLEQPMSSSGIIKVRVGNTIIFDAETAK
jgi:hypothetical protein